MKLYRLRLIARKGWNDVEGKNCGYSYTTHDVYLPPDSPILNMTRDEGVGFLPEIIGGEWAEEEADHDAR